jgi:threonine/homoserine/homoserine lactone efflux protein
MLGLFIKGLTLALTAVAIPGPSQAYLVSVALQAGWRRALWVAIAPIISDIPIVIGVLLVLNQMAAIVPSLIQIIQVLGGFLLLYIAWTSWKLVRSGVMFGAAPEGEKPIVLEPRQIVTQAVLVNLFSPGPYLFWTTVNGPILLGGLQESIFHGLAFLVGFYGTFFTGFALIGYVFAQVGQVNPRVTRVIMHMAVALIVLFALQSIASGLGLLS